MQSASVRQPALSFWMPWGWLCCEPRPDDPSLPIKDVENRGWATDFRGRIYVHGAKKFEIEAFSSLQIRTLVSLDIWRTLCDMRQTWKTGAIIGEVDIVDCVVGHKSQWALPDQYNWLLRNPKRYDVPIPYPGQRKFFEVRL